MIIETRDAEDAREIARKLLAAAGSRSGQVRTVWRGARIAFRVPDELGAAVGRAPDTSDAAEQPAKTEPAPAVAGTAEPAFAGKDDGQKHDPTADPVAAQADPVAAGDPVAADPAGQDTPDDPAPKKRGRKRIE